MRTRIFTALLAALVVSSPLLAEEPKTMVLEGDFSATYASGDFLIWTPKSKEKRGGAVGMSMSAATSMPAATSTSTSESPKEEPPSFESTLNVIAKAPLAADGTFRIEVPVEEPRVVYFYVLNAIGHEGQRYGAVKSQSFVLEPGNLRITMNEGARFVIHGGEFNDAIFNSWRTSDEYLEATAENNRLWKPVEGETEEQRRARVDLASAAQSRLLDIETNTRAEVATTHPDPLVRRLVIETAWLHGPWVIEAVRGLAEMTPDDPWVIERLAAMEEAEAKRAEGRRIAIGTDIIDFTAETLEGDSVRLADIRAGSEVVLVEFWASWCGPCRTEIPHMKQAYEEHKPKGFEIVSFTIDNNREDWELASEEEDLPWPNLGMGEEAEAATAYSVTGVPQNYLVDSSTGEILATNLRGHHLDVKLEEIFD